jgi:ABC-type multidrug transport system ATPase subunit
LTACDWISHTFYFSALPPLNTILVTFITQQSGNGDKNPERTLLHEVWGEVPARETTAIMGPSGAGKSSLLNILAGRATSRGRVKISADIRLDNYAVDPRDINVRKKIAFVAQDDSLQVTATPREAIYFSAKLRLPRNTTESQLRKLTKRMIKELGLSSCADTIVGGALIKGISGGERKRTSVGVELVVKPALVFLDEPTSGRTYITTTTMVAEKEKNLQLLPLLTFFWSSSVLCS